MHCGTARVVPEKNKKSGRREKNQPWALYSAPHFTLPSSSFSLPLRLSLFFSLSLCVKLSHSVYFSKHSYSFLILTRTLSLSLSHTLALSRCRVTYLNYSLDFDIFLVPVAFFQYGLLSMNETDRTCRRHSSLPLSNRLRIGIGRKKTVRWRHSSRIAQGLARDKYLLWWSSIPGFSSEYLLGG